MTKTTALVAAALFAAACGGARSGESVIVEGEARARDPLEAIDILEDRRVFDPLLAELSSRADALVRERVALATGRIGAPEGSPILNTLLDDVEAQVRDAAAFASGLLGESASAELRERLAARVEVEERAEGIAALLDAIGRLGDESTPAALVAHVGDSRPEVRAAALRALGVLGQRGIPVPDEVTRRIATGLADEHEPCRFMAAFALYRIASPLPGPEEAAVALSSAVAGDSSAEVRAYAARALARRRGLDGEMIARALADEDDRVASNAVAAIGLTPEQGRCSLVEGALAVVARRLAAEPELADGPHVHAARAALELAVDCREREGVLEHAGRVDGALSGVPGDGSAGRARVLCLARLVTGADDLALLSCDPARPHVGKKAVIRRLGNGEEISDAALATLIEFVADADLRVAIAALGALSALPREGAREAVVKAIDDERELVVAAALDAVAMHADRFRVVAEGAPGAAQPEVIEAIGRAVDRFAPFDHSYAPTFSAVFALTALGDGAAGPILKRLVVDPRPPIRSAVLAAFAAIEGIDPPAGLPPLSPPRPVAHGEKDDWRARDEATARVRTTRGAFTIALRSDLAPGTVASFASLAGKGYYDDTEIHRVVPNFVVQAGDPTGTGLGDPGYALRCEVNPEPYARGTVGMALAGKDTGGSQFFVALSRQPHLDGNYTVFGSVTDGMEVLDLLEEGDLILEIVTGE